MSIKESSPTTEYDAIIVLGGGINSSGEIPDFVKKRIEAAIKVSQNNTPILMTGRWSFLISYTPPQTEASAMRDYALACSELLNPDKIMLEEVSMDTIGNAYYTKEHFLEPHAWRHIVLITSDFHIGRAAYVFRKVLGTEYVITPEAIQSGFSSQELQSKAVLENKILDFVKQHLELVHDGDTEAVRAVINLFPGYSSTPKYTQADLLKILDIGVPVVDAYGIKDNQFKPE